MWVHVCCLCLIIPWADHKRTEQKVEQIIYKNRGTILFRFRLKYYSISAWNKSKEYNLHQQVCEWSRQYHWSNLYFISYQCHSASVTLFAFSYTLSLCSALVLSVFALWFDVTSVFDIINRIPEALSTVDRLVMVFILVTDLFIFYFIIYSVLFIHVELTFDDVLQHSRKVVISWVNPKLFSAHCN